jgi:hypothetical protein
MMSSRLIPEESIMTDDTRSLSAHPDWPNTPKERYETFVDFGQFVLKYSWTVFSGILAMIVLVLYVRSQYDIPRGAFVTVIVLLPISLVLAWLYNYSKYSKPGFIEISDEIIIWNIQGKERIFKFATLRDVDIPSSKELANGSDYIYLYFGDGENLELEKLLPHFSDIKKAILKRIVIHPDLHFLRVRLSKEAA